MFSSFLFLSFFYSHARLSYFSWLKGYRSLQISKTVRFTLSFLFRLYDEYECFPMLISYDYLVWLLEWTLNYYSIYLLLSLLSKPELWYLTCEVTKFNNYDGFILNMYYWQLCCLDLPTYLVLKVAIKLNYKRRHCSCLMVRVGYNMDWLTI